MYKLSKLSLSEHNTDSAGQLALCIGSRLTSVGVVEFH